jgi:hypothetical protein
MIPAGSYVTYRGGSSGAAVGSGAGVGSGLASGVDAGIGTGVGCGVDAGTDVGADAGGGVGDGAGSAVPRPKRWLIRLMGDQLRGGGSNSTQLIDGDSGRCSHLAARAHRRLVVLRSACP